MKKCLFYLFAMLCAMSLFSCGDDNGKNEPDPGPGPDNSWKEIAKDYTGDKLQLKFNGNESATKTIKLETSSAEKGTVSLGDLIAGVADLKVDVTMKTTKAEAAVIPNYALEGTKTVDSRTISVTGGVISGVLSLNVDVKVASSIVGKWGLAPDLDTNGDGIINDQDYNMMAGCFFIKLETLKGEVDFGEKTLKDMEFCAFADMQAEKFLRASLQEVSFLENGNVEFTYIKDGQAKPLAGLVGYYEKDKVVYMTIDVMAIMGMISSKATEANTLADLLALAQNGIPLAYQPAEDGKSCQLLITKEMATQLIPKLTPLMEILPTMIPGLKDNPAALAMMQQIGGLLQSIATSKDFSVGFNLVKK